MNAAAPITPRELKERLRALCAEIGPKACAWVQIASNISGTVSVALHPDDLLGKVTLRISCDELAEVEPALREAWEKHRDLHAANLIRGMALDIIRLTADLGECTDAALRCDYSQQDIDRYGDAAASMATEMGGNGPFTIVRLGVGNMPEAA